jgi:predicted DNA-binding protein (UPF0251 family)
MVRPRKSRLVESGPKISYFKPRGIPLSELEETTLTVDELEALRLADLLGLSHEEAGERMGVSRATFGRIVQKARLAVADALVNGKALQVQGGAYQVVPECRERRFRCRACSRDFKAPRGAGRPGICPHCGSPDFHRHHKDNL